MAKDNGSFVDAIVKDPANPPRLKLLAGYVGKSATAGHVRIYTTPELSEHIEVPEGSILHSQDVPDDHFGAKYLWIQRDADITRRSESQPEMRAKFLAGPLTAGLADAAQPAGGMAAAAPGPQAQIPSVQLLCPTPSFLPAACPQPSFGGNCPSIDTSCRTLLFCPTLSASGCPVNTSVNCPTRSLLCPSIAFCPTAFQNCPIVTRFIDCPRPTLTPNCPVLTNIAACLPTQLNCPTFGACPSAVDACPSAMCLPGGFNPLM
jgi:hypothetical protein